jgi:hypothetical protein
VPLVEVSFELEFEPEMGFAAHPIYMDVRVNDPDFVPSFSVIPGVSEAQTIDLPQLVAGRSYELSYEYMDGMDYPAQRNLFVYDLQIDQNIDEDFLAQALVRQLQAQLQYLSSDVMISLEGDDLKLRWLAHGDQKAAVFSADVGAMGVIDPTSKVQTIDLPQLVAGQSYELSYEYMDGMDYPAQRNLFVYDLQIDPNFFETSLEEALVRQLQAQQYSPSDVGIALEGGELKLTLVGDSASWLKPADFMYDVDVLANTVTQGSDTKNVVSNLKFFDSTGQEILLELDGFYVDNFGRDYFGYALGPNPGQFSLAGLSSITVLADNNGNGGFVSVATSNLLPISLGLAVPPIVLDLEGDGVISTLSYTQGVLFDLNADGVLEQVGWASPHDGQLARDLNGDRKINNGAELFGTVTHLSSGGFAADGYDALRDLDDYGDLLLNADDAAFEELLVWKDQDSDGITDEGELFTLAEMEITELSLQTIRNPQTDQGNYIEVQSLYTMASGEQRVMADVWFLTAPLPV